MRYLVHFEITGSIELDADNEQQALAMVNELPELELLDNICNLCGTSAELVE